MLAGQHGQQVEEAETQVVVGLLGVWRVGYAWPHGLGGRLLALQLGCQNHALAQKPYPYILELCHPIHLDVTRIHFLMTTLSAASGCSSSPHPR